MKIYRNSFGDLVVYGNDGQYKSMAMREVDGGWLAVCAACPTIRYRCHDEDHARIMAVLMIGMTEADHEGSRRLPARLGARDG